MSAKRRKRQHTGKSSKRQTGSAPGWAWMLFGLSIGLGVALVVWLQSDPAAVLPGRTAAGDLTLARTGTPSAAQPPAPAADSAAAPTGGRSAAASAAANPAGAEASGDDEEYSFFRELPESEVVIPESEFRAREQAGPAPEYIIQAGSFRAFADADSVQARLAFLGIESKVESAIVGNELYHRVIIGPLSGREEINSTVRRLNAARIDSMPPRQLPR